MAAPKGYRWQKHTSSKQENAFFELWKGEEPLLHLGFSTDRVCKITFHPNFGGINIKHRQLLDILEDGRTLAEQDLRLLGE